jgi:hypothetical protein
MHKHDDRDEAVAKQQSFLARVSAVNGVHGGCKTVSATLEADRGSKVRRAVIVGIEGRRKSTGVLVKSDKEGTQAHIFYDARTLRRLPKGASVRVDWSPVGEHLMTNIAFTITDPDYDKADPQEG